MNIIRNEKLIQRNSRIAQYTLVSSMAVLAGGMFISLRYQNKPYLWLGALMVGFLLSQVAIYFSNRFGRRPRLDELMDQALKGIDKRHTIYHYMEPVSHLLVGPTGLWVLMPYYQRGTISYSRGRYRQRGGGVLYQYLRILGQEGIGRPDLETAAEIEHLESYLRKSLPEGEEAPPIQAALVFINSQAVIDISDEDEPPVQAVALQNLKELVRKAGKGKSLTPERLKLIQEALPSG